MPATETVSPRATRPPAAPAAIGIVALGCVSMAFAWQSVLTLGDTATAFLSSASWHRLVTVLGGSIEVEPAAGGSPVVYGNVPFLPIVAPLLCVSAGLLLLAGFVMRVRDRVRNDIVYSLSRTSVAAWRWWLIPGIWELLRILGFVVGEDSAAAVLTSLVRFVMAISFAGWLVDLTLPLVRREEKPNPAPVSPTDRVSRCVIAAVVVYVIAFTVMNWQLYFGLLIPHGDSVMYEEHLWNITHGKGFRSYLDQGLFLGEHVQLVHLLLLPLHALWPSHLLLELCESLALASGALPVFWITCRATGSRRCGTLLAVAYLLYPALQFLDIAADLKTFRPISFGVPALLFALDQMERKRVRTTLLLFALTLSAKEDYALILGPLGLWIAASPLLQRFADNSADESDQSKRTTLFAGIGLTVFAVAYLLLATRVVIPWFRNGAELHYVSYFPKFGDSFGAVVINMLTNPRLLFSELVTAGSCGYLLSLLFPLAFLPVLSPSRFAVGVPILGLLCLNELVKIEPQPWHHFHAPVVPVLFWSAAHGAARLQQHGRFGLARLADRLTHATPEYTPALALTLCLCFGAFVGSTPLGVRFWDPGSFYHWRSLYAPDRRAELFPLVLEQVPADARVASTDFVHPRFTHHERSYDYSHYRRRVAGYEDRVPDDTDFIVIDTHHHYSEIHSPDQVRELQTEPHNWDLLEDRTDGHFIILRRREHVE